MKNCLVRGERLEIAPGDVFRHVQFEGCQFTGCGHATFINCRFLKCVGYDRLPKVELKDCIKRD